MKGPIQIKFGLSFFPTLQYSSTPKELAPVPTKPFNPFLALRTRFSMVNEAELDSVRIIALAISRVVQLNPNVAHPHRLK